MLNAKFIPGVLLTTTLLSSSQIFAQALFEADVESVRIIGSGERYSPRQSIAPGGGSRHTANYDVTVTWNPADWQAREEWVMHTIYPTDTTLEFTMTYDETKGLNDGRDSFFLSEARTIPMGAARIGTNFKHLWLTNPIILGAHADSSLPATRISLNGKPMDRVLLSAFDTQWVMIIDPDTGLPAEVITTEVDPNNAQAPNRVIFSNWRDVAGVPFPFQVEQYVNGKIMRREIRSSIELNPGRVNLDALDDLEETDAEMREWGWARSHLLLGRAGLGGPEDNPQISNVVFNEVGPDIYQVAGGGHHGLAIIGPDGIAMVDAPWFPERSATILGQMEMRWPGLPVRYIILTHHHIDHTGGFRGFVEAGATLVVHEDAVPFYDNALELAGHTNTRAVSVRDRATLNGIGREIEVVEVLTSHTDAAVATYVPDTKLLFNADLFSPGRQLQFTTWTNELLDSARYHGLDVERHVGGHGAGYGPAPE